MKTKKAKRNHRKTQRGGAETEMKQLIKDILNYAIKFRMRSDQDKFGIYNPEVYYRTLTTSASHKKMMKNLANYVLKKINKDLNWANIWNDTDKTNRTKILIQIILSHAGLYYGGLTQLGEDLGDFMNVFQQEMEDIDDKSNELMIYYILYQSGVRVKIDEVWNLNYYNNLNKIKALTHKVPQIGDAETMEMLTEYFDKDKPDKSDVYPFNTGVKPFLLKDHTL